MSWNFSAFADEAGPSCDEQISALRKCGMHFIDIRAIDGHNISVLPVAQAKVVRQKLDDAGIRVIHHAIDRGIDFLDSSDMYGWGHNESLLGKAHIKVPAGTQSGSVFRLKGKGVKNVQGAGTGDLLVRVAVEVPSHLNHAQKTKLQEFAELCDSNVNPISKSFFEKAKSFFTRG